MDWTRARELLEKMPTPAVLKLTSPEMDKLAEAENKEETLRQVLIRIVRDR